MLVIVQARLSSSRLPGKVLRDLGGRPMLAWTLERVRAATQVTKVVVATSTEASDDPLAIFCAAQGVDCYRGSLENVAARYALAARAEAVNAFIRITGDAPLIDPAIIDWAIKLYHAGDWDLVTNVLVRTFPKGQSAEVLRSSTFFQVCAEMSDPVHLEHVTPFYYENLGRFRIAAFTSGSDKGGVQLSVDTPEDFAVAEYLVRQSGGRPQGWRELLALKDTMPMPSSNSSLENERSTKIGKR